MQNLIINISQVPIKSVANKPIFSKMSKALLRVVAVITLLSSDSLAFAREAHDAHTHGVADLTLAFENGFLEIELESPAMSFLSFEHEPENEEQLETIERTKEILSSASKVITINGSSCGVTKARVDIHGPAGRTEVHSGAHEANDHDSHNDHESDEDHESHENHDGVTSHSEVSASYLFSCDDGEKPASVAVTLFSYFPNLKSINVNWVTETQQGHNKLSSESQLIELK